MLVDEWTFFQKRSFEIFFCFGEMSAPGPSRLSTPMNVDTCLYMEPAYEILSLYYVYCDISLLIKIQWNYLTAACLHHLIQGLPNVPIAQNGIISN